MQIQLEKLRFHAHHGVMPQERVTGQDYELDLTLSLRDSVAIQALTADCLESTVNYADVYDVVAHEMHQPSSLLEYVAERIVEALLRQFPQVMAVEVRLTKLAPPILGFDGRGATVVLRRRRVLLVLDFDGTLADTSKGIVATMNATFDACGFPRATDEAICRTIGLPLVDSVAMLAGDIEGEELQHAVATYRCLFEKIGTANVSLFPHVSETLHTLHHMGFTLAVATSRGHASVVQLCRNLGIYDCMTHFVACEDVSQAKPHPEAVLTLMKQTRIPVSQTWVVGDTTFDIGMGRRAGARTIGVTYGNHSREDLESAHATRIISDFADVASVLLDE